MKNNVKIALAALLAIPIAACGSSSGDTQDASGKKPAPVKPQAVALNPQGLSLAARAYGKDIVHAVLGKDSMLTLDGALAALGIDMMVDAGTYAADYGANEIAADNKYKGKAFLITGKVESINKDFTGDGYLTLSAAGSLMGVQARLTSEATQAAASISKGALAYLVCGSGMKIGPMVSASNCTRFSQHAKAQSEAIGGRVTGFFEGRVSMPRDVAQSLLALYVVGSRLPADSPCLADVDQCDAVFDKLAQDKVLQDELQAEIASIAQAVKVTE